MPKAHTFSGWMLLGCRDFVHTAHPLSGAHNITQWRLANCPCWRDHQGPGCSTLPVTCSQTLTLPHTPTCTTHHPLVHTAPHRHSSNAGASWQAVASLRTSHLLAPVDQTPGRTCEKYGASSVAASLIAHRCVVRSGKAHSRDTRAVGKPMPLPGLQASSALEGVPPRALAAALSPRQSTPPPPSGCGEGLERSTSANQRAPRSFLHTNGMGRVVAAFPRVAAVLCGCTEQAMACIAQDLRS
jgi:hypothetical protein